MYNKNSYQQHYLNNPQFSSSPTIQYSRSNDSVLDLNGNEILLHNHHHGAHNLFNNHYLAANNAPFLEAAALFNNLNQELEIPNEDPVSMTDPKKQNVARKDRHSKIYTSQGPRDRRVRLSIGIARKFFDLQELLDFDKPSKTLDWLLSKSKAAIKELVQSKTLSSPTSESEEVLSNGNSLGVVPDLKGKSVANKCKVSSSLNFAKESRAKARARARERTKEKMCIKQLNEATRNLLEVSGSREAGIHHYPVTCFGATDQDLIEEIKRKLMKQQNWDYSNFVDQSNELCSILDQHKFIN